MSVRGDLRSIAEAVIAFAFAVLPEKVKREGYAAAYATPAGHVASGFAEMVASAGLFIAGLIPYVASFSTGPGLRYLESQPTLTHGDFFGVGVLAFVSYLIRPTSLLLVYCLGEGILRILEAAYWERLLGIAIVAVPWRIAVRLKGELRRLDLAAMIGPYRPDEIVPPEQSPFAMLEVYSVEDKPWSEYQVVEHQGEFFILAGRRLVPRGQHHAWRYQFHRLEEREIIRGTIVPLTPPSPAPSAQPSVRETTVQRTPEHAQPIAER